MKGKNTSLTKLCYHQLTDVSIHTTLHNAHVLFVVIGGIQFRVFCGENSSYLLIGDIPTHFTPDVLSVVKLTTFQGDKKICLIRFHNIPQILPSNESCPSCFPPMTFSVGVFKKEQLIDVRFAIKSNEYSPNFGVGCFDMRLFFEKFRRTNLLVYCIPVLWKNLIKALCDIEYFKIYKYDDFQTSVLVCFQRMFVFPQHRNTIRELFYSFVWKLLKMNSWFLIIEQSIQYLQLVSDELIGIFSNHTNPPIVNFIDRNSNVVGLTIKTGVGIDFKIHFVLVSIQSTKVYMVGLNEPEGFFHNSQESDFIISKLFPSDKTENDKNDKNDFLHIRRISERNDDISAITQGFSRFGPLELIIFKIGNSINVFIKRSDGTFKKFNFYFFIMSKIFAHGYELNQLTNHLTSFPCISINNIVKGLLDDGFLQIFDGTPTIEQISDFLFKSDFGCVLQRLRHEIEGFPERLRKECLMKYKEEVEKGKVENPMPVEDLFKSHLDSIRENDFIGDFKRIFEFLLEKLGNRDDLTPEIREILHFLGQLVEFLNPV